MSFVALVNRLCIWFVQTTSKQPFLSEMTSNQLCVNELVLLLSGCHILSNLGRTDERSTSRILLILSIGKAWYRVQVL